MADYPTPQKERPLSLLERSIGFCLANKLIVFLVLLLLAGWGLRVAPFDWPIAPALRDPVPADAIPDIGENQQIVFTDWPGRSPRDVEDQITYPLTSALMGIPEVKTIRSVSMFGFSSIYLIFTEKADFYWSRSRILEKLGSLPENALPDGVKPVMGPDATAMGQVFWYTLEGRDEKGQVTGGWDLHELRSIQDWQVRYALLGVEGVSEVAAVGGHVQEYQVDLDPDLMRVNAVGLEDVVSAIQAANRDVGARSIEINKVEYLIRGIGFVKDPTEIEDAVIRLDDGVPLFVKQVARVARGPAYRQGVLDKGGAEAVGGVVAVRYGENPLAVIQRVKNKIQEIAPGLPRKVLADGRQSQVQIVPFYDRTQLIQETLGTLQDALIGEILVTIIVIIGMVKLLHSSLVIAAVMPLSVLGCFIAMKIFHVDANIVALSGIAIAIGTMDDMGIIVTENIQRHLEMENGQKNLFQVVLAASMEVGGAVVTAIATTIVGFVPVFFLTDAEGKLFRPLAFTKTFALLASLIVAIYVIPPVMHAILKIRQRRGPRRNIFYEGLIYAGGVAAFFLGWQAGLALIAVGAYHLIEPKIPLRWYPGFRLALNLAVAAAAAGILSHYWSPLGPTRGTWANFLFAAGLIASILGAFLLFLRVYPFWLRFGLNHKKAFLVLPSALILLGLTIWQGYDRLWGWLPRLVNAAPPAKALARLLPGLGEEFMPPLDEGAFLLMPSTMPHVAIGEAQDILQKQDMALSAIPEIDTVVGKIGRTASPLDPAPIAMFETVINYHPEYMRDAGGNLLRFSFSAGEKDLARRPNGLPLLAEDGASYHIEGRFLRDENLGLIPDPNGRPYRLWRPALDPALNPGRRPWPGIRDANDIWQAVSRTAHIPGTTAAAKLQPISARIVMLQSGIRASLGVKVKGPDIISVEAVAGQIEGFLREVPAIEPATVIADRIMAKPYLEIEIDRKAIAQYGIRLATVLDVIEFAIGGRPITTTVEGRARYPVRVRYLRELRDDLESLGRILVPASDNTQIPLTQLARIQYARGPEVIKGENTFPTGYVLFDKKAQYSDGEVVDKAAAYLKEMLDSGQWVLPSGVSYSFTGTYENQIRSRQRLAVIIPVSLLVIFIILYLQFHSAATSSIVFTGIAVAASGGFLMLWLYAQPWFLNFELFGVSIRQLFSIHPIHLSVAIWVGFLALFGIATDDGVVMATYLQQAFSENRPLTIAQIRETAVTAALRRVRPCLMTSATTIIALLPVLSSAGRGSEIMIPMAIPAFGGMTVGMISMLVVPVIYCWIQEHARVKSQET